MKILHISVFFLISTFFCSLSGQQTILDTINHDNLARDYRLYIPSNYSPDEALPLVFNLHGFGSNAFEQQIYSGMNAVADTGRFLVCYPNGVDEAWNVGWAFGSTADDVSFLEELITVINQTYPVDDRRVYSCGMSNGGFMSYTLACNSSDKIAAIASVTGSMIPNGPSMCLPERPIPVLEIHGTADGTVPYNGLLFVAEPIESVISYWVGFNNCAFASDTIPFPDIDMTDGCIAERINYSDCDENVKVSLIKIFNGGHTWPGAAINIGTTNQDFSASPTIWDFFQQYRLPEVVTNTTTLVEEKSYKLYPNPVGDTELFLVKSNEENNTDDQLRYEIIGMDGRSWQKGKISGHQTVINTNAFPKGIYSVIVSNKGGNWIDRLIKL